MRDDERERHLYITGRTVEAAAIAYWIDAESDTIDEMRHERDMAQESNGELTKENEQLQDALEAAESRALTLDADLENAHDLIKALQAKIHEAGVDLV